jgi:hypothetical protein
MTITRSDARAYLDRWTLVKEIEGIELRKTSMDMKVQQLASLMESRELFGDDPKRQQEVQHVRERWAQLREIMGQVSRE